MMTTYLIQQSNGCFWKSQGCCCLCSLQIEEGFPQDSSSPCSGAGEKIQWQGSVSFYSIPIENLLSCQIFSPSFAVRHHNAINFIFPVTSITMQNN